MENSARNIESTKYRGSTVYWINILQFITQCKFYSEDHSVSHTATANGWWKLTLPSVYYISYIDIYNRVDCCSSRINGVTVYIDDVLIYTIQYHTPQKYNIPVDKSGRSYFNIFVLHFNILYLSHMIVVVFLFHFTWNIYACFIFL